METWLFQHYISAPVIIIAQSFLIILCFMAIAKILHFQKRQSKQISQMQNEIKAINSGNIGIGRKINLFGKEIAKVEIDKMTQLQPGSQEKTYHQASILLKRGASIEEVVNSCDIAPAEAELLSIMSHAKEVSNKNSTNNKTTENSHPTTNKGTRYSMAS